MSNTRKPLRFATSSLHDGVAVITIDNPPVNAISSGVPEAVTEELRDAVSNPEVRAIVLIGAGRTFVAGVDLRQFGEISRGIRPPLDLYPFLLEIEDCPKPVIAAIHGTALGGGLELAMAAHYRVVAPGAQLGMPEVKLGLIPGMAGTQRLPRLVELAKAAEMCCWGEPVSSNEAVSIGLADAVVEGDLLNAAMRFAVGKTPRKTRDREVAPADLEPIRRKLAGLRKYGRAPQIALEALESAAQLPFEEGCQRERDLFQERVASPESQALIHVFFAERAVGKLPAEPKKIELVGIIGAGTMGSGIAIAFADAGIPVRLKEADDQALSRGIARIKSHYETIAGKGRITAEEAARRVSRISGQIDYAGFDNLHLVIEAVFEKLEVKQRIFAELRSVVSRACLLATNTSSLDVEAIGADLGLHFFSPANVMRLLEVVRTPHTSDAAVASAIALGKCLGKIAVVARNAPGFIGNRIFAPYLREARLLVEQGASVEQVNDALVQWGMAMGPLAVDDLTGLDISLEIEELGGRRSPLLRALVERGRLGQKNGRGWSRYDADRKPQSDPDVAALAGTKQEAPFTSDQIVDRCISALVEEGRKVLAEGVASQEADIDIVAIHGFGFPAWRGGPMFYATGRAAVLEA